MPSKKAAQKKISQPKADRPLDEKIAKGAKKENPLASSIVAKKLAPIKGKTDKPTQRPKTAGLTVNVFDVLGKSAGTILLPKETFGQKPNKKLLTQAMHVYFTNNSGVHGHTKTRAEVRGGGRKPWRQKGTGNARAGSNRSPIWVGGGKALGPRYRDVKLEMPKKMKKGALVSALSQKALDGNIRVITGIEKIEPKTKIVANLLAKIGAFGPTLLVASAKNQNLKLASRNAPKVKTDSVENLNAFSILTNKNILFSKEAIEKFK